MRVGAREAFAIKKDNPRSDWHLGGSDHVTENPDHAAARIFTSFGNVVPAYNGPKLTKDTSIFAMGSCFAREIEHALTARGANVTSIDYEKINRPEFQDAEGRIRDGFFHRFTPRAIWHEFMIAFGRLKGWEPERSLLFPVGSDLIDLNYWNVDGSDLRPAANMTRRQIAREMVQRVTHADVVILTLGLTEGWIHTPTGFHINRFVPKLARHGDDFAFELQSYDDVVLTLSQIHKLLSRRKGGRAFQLVVTISPVPLQQTFTQHDVVIANMDSKATLRAAARAFADRHDNVHYFPSYEMVLYTNAKYAWRPDRIHVNRGMVDHIVSRFIEAYYAPGELKKAKVKVPGSDDFL